jgi:hypothetical protein
MPTEKRDFAARVAVQNSQKTRRYSERYLMEKISVWYPVKEINGEHLPGIKVPKASMFFIPHGAIGHIMYRGIFLCGRTEAQILFNIKAPKGIEKAGALIGHQMCLECANAYKANPELPWFKWRVAQRGKEET